MKKSIGISLLLFFLFSCELVVDIDIPFEHPQLTVNALFRTDSLWVATVSLNQHILDDTPTRRVENASVVVYRDNQPIDTLTHIVNGVYRSDTGRPEVGKHYEIRVAAEGYLPASASSHIPLPAQITKVDVVNSLSADGYPETSLRVEFEDDPTQANFYQLFIETETEVFNPSTNTIYVGRSRISIASDDPLLEDDENWLGYDGILVKDVFFTGGKGVVTIKTTTYDFESYPYVIVVLRTLSEDYYRYKTTATLQSDISGNPFAQPLNVYNNVKNGFGIFAGYVEHNHTVGEKGPPPFITSISPLEGKSGDHVVITGGNFGSMSYNSGGVIFSSAGRYAISNTVRREENEIEVIIPPDAITGKIFVSNGSRMTSSDVDFTITE